MSNGPLTFCENGGDNVRFTNFSQSNPWNHLKKGEISITNLVSQSSVLLPVILNLL